MELKIFTKIENLECKIRKIEYFVQKKLKKNSTIMKDNLHFLYYS